MTIHTLISQTTPPLLDSDTVERALGLLMEFRVRHLPVVNNEQYLLGVISENQLLDSAGPDVTLDNLVGPAPLSARPDEHLFDVTKRMVDHGLTALPIADDMGQYLGVVRRHDLFEQFAHMLSTQEPGAILALEVDPRHHSLARLVYMIEQNDVKILSVATEPRDGATGMIRITLKLNVSDTTRVRHIAEHEGYRVVAAFNEDEGDEDLQLRVDAFLRYLEV